MALNPQVLQIVKGIAAIPGDTSSAEQPLESIDLLNRANIVGLTLEQDGWTPTRAPLKQGGSFISSPTVDNRTLVATAYDTASEQMRLTISAETDDLCYAQFRILGQLAQAAEDFHVESYQPLPVYLKRQLPNENYPLYALIYTIEFEVDRQTFITETDGVTYDVTLTIVREAAWRLIPPCANPKLATAIIRGFDLDSTDDYSLVSTQLQLVYETIQNRREWNTTQTAEVSKNYVDIAAAYIVGDAPPLVELIVGANNAPTTIGSNNTIVVGASSERTPITDRAGTSRNRYLTLNAGDATVQTDTVIGADTGAPFSDSQSAGRRSATTFVTTTMAGRLFWSTAESKLDLNMFRGQFACFLRCRLSAAGGVSARLRVINVESTSPSSSYLYTTPVSIDSPTSAGTGNTVVWGTYYMGVIDIENIMKAYTRADGLGYDISTSNPNLGIVLEASRTSGTPVFYVSDLILIPYGEASLLINGYNSAGLYPTGQMFIADSTGYFGRNPNGFAYAINDGSPSVGGAYGSFFPLGLQGDFLTLKPGVKNRLYFLWWTDAGAFTYRGSEIANAFNVWMNIVPRWYGECDLP